MGCLFPCSKTVPAPPFRKTVNNNFPSTYSVPWSIGPQTLKNPLCFPSPSTSPFTVSCRERIGDELLSISAAYAVLGVQPNCSVTELKSAFRAKVKQFHPDVRKDGENSDTMIRRVILAYEVLFLQL
ncbi:hypothetical protein F0562_019894 [Nyssa sinensis]|uniref:J domain-containing protein n=1 Tax=Nyssa sinensis TaxID=561372 RepID=A0A5J5BSQ6_9ASTE|nr:hypothetical protein F0562_019894 [Nyssa sinensis]